MDFDRLIKLQDSILDNTLALLRDGGDPAVVLARPRALHEARASRLTGRIAGLEAEKASQVERIDSEIRALKGELKVVSSQLDADRRTAYPAPKASGKTKRKPRSK